MALPILSAGATAWAWDTFGKDVVKEFGKEVLQPVWERIKWKSAANRYREHLYKQYSYTQIFGQSAPVPLEGIFTQVVVLNKPSAWHRHDVEALYKESKHDPQSVYKLLHRKVQEETVCLEGIELVHSEEGHRLFILGKPGAGKTTFLKYLILQSTYGELNKVPIFVALREWQGEGELLPFLARQFAICDFPEATPFIEHLLRKTERALVLFDGLDEIPQEGDRRATAIDALRDFARQYPCSQVVITCRTAASDYMFQGFHYVELADFEEGQMYAYVRKWFQATPSVGEDFWQDFQRDDNRGLRDFGRQPLLLSMLCLAYQVTHRFPQRRLEIYEEALDALLKKWDSTRQIRHRDAIYKKLSLGHKQQMFARLAADRFGNGIYFFPQRELAQDIAAYLAGLPTADQMTIEDIDGDAVLKAIEAQHGILTECTKGFYSFAHLTFQEYYTAYYVKNNALEGTVPRLLAHAHEDRWREVILLTASMFPDAEPFFDIFLKVLNTKVKGDAKLVKFLDWVTRKATSVQVPYKSVAVRAYYVYLDYARARDFTRDLNLDLDLARTLDLDLARDLKSVFAFARERDRDLALDRNRARAIARAIDYARDLTRDLNLDLDLALTCAFARVRPRDFIYARVYARSIVHDFSLPCVFIPYLARSIALNHDHDLELELDYDLALARDLDLSCVLAQVLMETDLHTALSDLTVPDKEASETTWEAFAESLRSIMIEQRDIGHEWDFTAAQVEILDEYLVATRLFVDCLDVAYVRDRSAIEERLLLPPG